MRCRTRWNWGTARPVPHEDNAKRKEHSLKRVLITGTAGFIGFHLAKLLFAEGFTICGYHGMTDYYDVALKQRRHQMLFAKPELCNNRGHA